MYAPYGGGAVVGLRSVLNEHMPDFFGGGTVQIVGDYSGYMEFFTCVENN